MVHAGLHGYTRSVSVRYDGSAELADFVFNLVDRYTGEDVDCLRVTDHTGREVASAVFHCGVAGDINITA